MKFSLKLFSIAFFTLIFSASGFSQNINHICGTDQMSYKDQYLDHIETLRKGGIVKERGAITYLPINYILGARTNGTGRVSEAAVLDMHCHLNERYAEQEIQFYIKSGEFTYINNDDFYENHGQATAIMTFKSDANAINVFLPRYADIGTGPQGSVLGYYSRQRDWLVVRNNQASNRHETLAHEMGHLFGLWHPHLGWDAEGFNDTHPDWPIAPKISPGGQPTEYVDGRNCSTASDMLCDTPADYNPESVGSGDCFYNDGAKDPAGVLIDPDETLIMAYFDDMCVERFSQDQQDMIRIDLNSNRRAKWRNTGFTPPATTVGEDVWVNSPTAPVPFNNGKVTLNWGDVPGATHYLIEISSNKFFVNGTTEFFTVEGSSTELTDIEPNEQYYYRIKPFNLAVSCSKISNIFSFTTTTSSVSSANDISFVKNFSVFPNPVKRNGELSVNVVSDESFEGDITVFDLTGKEVHTQKQFFKQGGNQFPIEMNAELSGVFILFIKTDSGILKQKFVVTD